MTRCRWWHGRDDRRVVATQPPVEKSTTSADLIWRRRAAHSAGGLSVSSLVVKRLIADFREFIFERRGLERDHGVGRFAVERLLAEASYENGYFAGGWHSAAFR